MAVTHRPTVRSTLARVTAFLVPWCVVAALLAIGAGIVWPHTRGGGWPGDLVALAYGLLCAPYLLAAVTRSAEVLRGDRHERRERDQRR